MSVHAIKKIQGHKQLIGASLRLLHVASPSDVCERYLITHAWIPREVLVKK